MTSARTRPNTATRPGQYPVSRRRAHATDNGPSIVESRSLLSHFVEHASARAADSVGFGWRPDPGAPDRFDDVLMAYRESERTGEPLAVSDQNCDDTIYTDPKINMAFRFWHDVSHVRRGLSFELVDELELARWHLGELERYGYGPLSVPYLLLRADLVGQVYVMALAHRFPINQRRFVLECLHDGLDAGVLAECRRSADGARCSDPIPTAGHPETGRDAATSSDVPPNVQP